ncbi:hypothetical protein AAG906_040590 [Vitis piasezkii]
MCGGNDHLAWKHSISFEACRGLRLLGGHILIPFFVLSQDRTFVLHLDIPSWDRVEEETFRIEFCSQPGYTFLVARDDAQYDPIVPPPPPPSQSAPQAMPFTLHSQTGVAPPPITVPTPTSEDPHANMDRLEQGLRYLLDLAKFEMPDIERYLGIGCPRLHLDYLTWATHFGLHLWRPRGAAHGTTWPRSSSDVFV